MTVLAAVLGTLTVLLLASGVTGGVVYRRRELERTADLQIAETLTDRLVSSLYVERVLVTLRSGESFSGLLVDVDDRSLLLHSAEAFLEGRKVPVDGELIVPRADVLYFQKP